MDNFLYALGKFFCDFDNYLILILSVLNAAVFAFLIIINKRIRSVLHPEGNKMLKKGFSPELSTDEKDLLSKKRRLLILLYSLYTNFTAIFPLLGILGTVAALMTNTDSAMGNGMLDNLMIALNTTLLGVIFAILFKAIDSFVSANMEMNLDEIDATLSR